MQGLTNVAENRINFSVRDNRLERAHQDLMHWVICTGIASREHRVMLRLPLAALDTPQVGFWLR